MNLSVLIIDRLKLRHEYTVQDVLCAYLDGVDKSGLIEDARSTPQYQRMNDTDRRTVERWLKAN